MVHAMAKRPGLVRMLARGMTKRCARCGSGGLFTAWVRMVPVCPRCELRFEREEGGWLGGIVVNIGATQLLVVAYLVVGLLLTWPDPPLFALIAIGIAVVSAFSVFFVPFSKTIWVAIDVWLRSLSPIDRRDVDESTYRARGA
jgi:uncharacterized protein (DUF983 family)